MILSKGGDPLKAVFGSDKELHDVQVKCLALSDQITPLACNIQVTWWLYPHAAADQIFSFQTESRSRAFTRLGPEIVKDFLSPSVATS